MGKKIAYWAIFLSALLVPCSGYVLLGRQARGFFMICWFFTFGYITFQLTGEQIHFTGRISGALAIWVLSLVETVSMAKKRYP
ncbi:MAG: hypothetical protein JEZ12_27040 [Desulfobacterium sp.]|nr:hypothetical protein [Desulfobacterium sp.]